MIIMLEKRTLALILTILFLGSGLATLNGAIGEVGTRVTPPKIATLYLNLTYNNGSAAPGIIVYVYQQDGWIYGSSSIGTTDPWGKVMINISGYDIGPCYVHASEYSNDLWMLEELFVEPGKTYHRDMVLGPALPKSFTIEGTVRYLSNGTAVNGAYYQVNGVDVEQRDVSGSGYTSSDGRFSVPAAQSNYGYNIFVSKGGLTSYSNHVFLNSSKNTYSLDIRLRSASSSLPVNIRFLDDNTGKPVKNPDIYMFGLGAYNDHLFANNWFWWIEPSGWVNQTLGRGEYFFNVGTSVGWGYSLVRFSTTGGVIVNETPVTKEFRLPLPAQYRNLTIKVMDKDTSGPISMAYMYSSDLKLRTAEFDLWTRSSSSTDPAGLANLTMIPMRDYQITLYATGYKTVQLTVPGGPAGHGGTMDVKLEKEVDTPPKVGTVSILAKDQKTGRPLPMYYVEGRGQDVYLWGETGPDGYLNGTISAGLYDRISIYGNLGTGYVESISIADGQTKSLTVLLTERKDFDRTPYCEYTFKVVNEAGTPLSNVYVPVIRPYDFGYDNHPTFSDENGMVRLKVRPGTYTILTTDTYDPLTSMRIHNVAREGVSIVVPATGGVGPDVTLYPSAPLTEVTGAVKDLKTGKSLHSVEMMISSGKDLDMPARDTMFIPDDLDVRYLRYTTYTTSSGYYRTYGKDTLTYSCYLNGYYPAVGSFDLTTRALNRNIYLEPLQSITTYINGTLMDYLGNTKTGSIYVYDLDRNDYLVNSTTTGSDGLFSMGVYPGRFRISYSNDTVSESMELTVGPEGVEGLQLILTPETMFFGKVVNWEGAPVADIYVELLSGTEFENGAVTNSEGDFAFAAEPGTYSILIDETELYMEYRGGPYVATGFNEFNLTIILENRTTGTILGFVIGDGPTPEPIADADVVLWDSAMVMSWPTMTNETGEFRLEDVPYGSGYTLAVDPPGYMKPDEGTYRSGYLNTTYGPFDLSSPELTVDVHLEYVVIEPPGYYNITSYSPTGDDVYLNEPIVIHFSNPMNVSTLMENVTIQPELEDPELEWRDNNMTLMITHSGFQPNTTYTVTVFGNLLSVEGYRLYGALQKTWNFTTGTEVMTWWLDESFVEVLDNGTVEARVTGGSNLTVFMVIDGTGSYPMTESPEGTYRVTIDRDEFEWDTTYSYHFSDTSGGPDKAPTLAGSLKIPLGQITSAKVTVKYNRDWQVDVTGSPGMDLYIVILGVGSFKLGEVAPGVYYVLVDGSNFNWSQTYGYHFSTSPNGAAPAEWATFSDTETMPKEKKEVDEPGNWCLICCIPLVILVILLLVIIVIVLLVRKGKGKGEKEQGWGEE